MKKIFTLMAVFALTMTAAAQTVTFDVTGKGNDELVVSMTNDFNCGAFGFKIALPEGTDLAFDDEEEDYVYTKNSERLSKKVTVDIKPPPTPRAYSFIISGAQVKLSEGQLFTFKLKNPITADAKIYAINFTDMGDDLLQTNSVYVENNENYEIIVPLNADAIKGISADETKSGVIYNMAGQRVSKATKGIYVVDGKKVAVSK